MMCGDCVIAATQDGRLPPPFKEPDMIVDMRQGILAALDLKEEVEKLRKENKKLLAALGEIREWYNLDAHNQLGSTPYTIAGNALTERK